MNHAIEADPYPIPTYRYRCDLAGEEIAFNSVSGLDLSHETIKCKDGSGAWYRMPGQSSSINVTLRRGEWVNQERVNNRSTRRRAGVIWRSDYPGGRPRPGCGSKVNIRGCSKHPQVLGLFHRCPPVRHAQFAINGTCVGLHRVDADVQQQGNVLIRHPGG